MKNDKTQKIIFSICYWFLSLTWGIIGTIIGILAVIGTLIFGGAIHKNGCSFIVEIGGNWGGLNLGPIALCGHYSKNSIGFYEHVRRHEFGHGIQHCVLGILFPLIIGIPSAIRYWYQRIRESKGLINKPYDSIWFEGSATKIGTATIDWYESHKNIQEKE